MKASLEALVNASHPTKSANSEPIRTTPQFGSTEARARSAKVSRSTPDFGYARSPDRSVDVDGADAAGGSELVGSTFEELSELESADPHVRHELLVIRKLQNLERARSNHLSRFARSEVQRWRQLFAFERRWRQLWEVCILLLALVSTTALPIWSCRIPPPVEDAETAGPLARSFLWCSCLFGLVDVLVQSQTPRPDEDEEQAQRHRRVLTPALCLDLLANLPLWALHEPWRWLSGNQLLRVARLARAVTGTHVTTVASRLSVNPSVLRLVYLSLVMFLYWHWVGCFWWAVRAADHTEPLIGASCNATADDEAGAGECALALDEDSLYARYVTCYYWSISTSMSVGTPLPTLTAREEAYATFVIISGLYLYLLAVSFMNSTTANLFALSSKSRQRVAQLEQYLHRSAVPPETRRRVLRFLSFMTDRMASTPHALAALPRSYQLLIDLQANRRLATCVGASRPPHLWLTPRHAVPCCPPCC